MDIYPDVLIKTIDKKYSYLIKFFLNPIFKYSYKKADKVIALGNQMQKILIKKNVDNSKIKIIPNWATGDLKVIKSHSQNKLYKEWGIFSKIRIIYSGNLGIAHDWETLLKALRISKLSPKDIQIIFISNGKRIKDAIAYSNKFLFKNSVIFKDLVEPALLPYSMGLANLACVSIRSSYGGLVAPSKFPGYLARGLPVIYVGPNSDISEILNNKNCGFSFLNDQVQDLAKLFYKLSNEEFNLNEISNNAKFYYEKHNSKEFAISSYKKIISKYKN